ncbi:MAG TPA: flagellar hook-length control protein FliK [Legionella sp.]|nr:flagellar hook-length control protein FliK [Legionella sp.]
MIDPTPFNLNLSIATPESISLDKHDAALNTDIELTDNEYVDMLESESNPFVLLLSQIQVTIPETKAVISLKDQIEQESLALKPQESAEQLNISDADEDPVTDDSINFDDNVAITWINSQCYLPPQLMESNQDETMVANVANEEIELVQVEKKLIVLNSDKDNKSTIQQHVMNNSHESNDDEMSDRKTLGETYFLDKSELELINNQDVKLNPQSSAHDAEILTHEMLQNADVDKQPNLVNLISESNSIGMQKPSDRIENNFLTISAEMNHSDWPDQFSERIVWLGKQEINSAQIKLHPENLGPLEINIKVTKDDASINIGSHNAQVRDVVEQALPKLREMMEAQGLNLAEVNIGADSNSRHFSQSNSEHDAESLNPTEEFVASTPLKNKLLRGIIDYFA